MKLKYNDILAITDKAVYILFSLHDEEKLKEIHLAAFSQKLWIPLSMCSLDKENKIIVIKSFYYEKVIKNSIYCTVYSVNNFIVTNDMIFKYIKL